MMKKILICGAVLFMAPALLAKQEDPLYYGHSSDNFVIRWAFQELCDHVFDPRTDQYVWPSKSKGGVIFDPDLVQPGDIIFVRDAPLFFKKMHPYIKHPYIIVSHGEHLDAMKSYHNEYIAEDKVIAWFGIHASKKVTHPKYIQIPIGVVQQPENHRKHSQLDDYFYRLRTTVGKEHMLYMNFADFQKPERKHVRNLFIKESYTKRGQRQPFQSYLKEMAQCKFTLSPKGLGPDCYRTWEALLVGSIPVVRTCQLDPLYEGLPVLIVDQWEEINEEFLHKKYKEITSKKYDISKLYMEYWHNKIFAVKAQFLASYR